MMSESINKQLILPLVLAADHSYVLPLTVAITSIVANKKIGYILKIYILDGGLSEEDKAILAKFKSAEIFLYYLKMDNTNFHLFPEKRHLKLATYYRLLAPELIPAERFIYLDCDLIVNYDVLDLYQIDLGGNVIAAVLERSQEYIKKYYFRRIEKYFNAGVLLINVKAWKAEKIWERALVFLAENSKVIKYADQDILNHLFENKWLEIDESYNFQLDKHQIWDNKKEFKILHFVGERKPWQYLYRNKYKKYFVKYLELSPLPKYLYPDKNIYIFFQKYTLEPIFVFFKKVLKKIAPPSLMLRLKNLHWYFCNKRDSR